MLKVVGRRGRPRGMRPCRVCVWEVCAVRLRRVGVATGVWVAARRAIVV